MIKENIILKKGDLVTVDQDAITPSTHYSMSYEMRNFYRNMILRVDHVYDRFPAAYTLTDLHGDRLRCSGNEQYDHQWVWQNYMLNLYTYAFVND